MTKLHLGAPLIKISFLFLLQWHLGFFAKEYTPVYRGFDSFYGFWNGKEDFWNHSSYEEFWGTDLRDNMRVRKNDTHTQRKKERKEERKK